ncbi:MAG: hypothetical protein NT013_08795, partial [Planctomycetia bacterium]|nr:hypothetical protein [Planctomycetia bacterium]
MPRKLFHSTTKSLSHQRVLLVLFALTGVPGTMGCHNSEDTIPANVATAPSTLLAQVDPGPVHFVDVAKKLGLNHEWPQQPRPMRTPDAFGSGCAFLDFDQDGWQDVL